MTTVPDHTDQPHVDAPDPAELREIARSVAREAVELVRDRRRGGVDVADTKSSATDVVTEVDRASEELIRRLLIQARPHDSILGEEGDDHVGTSTVRWVVDPIDGTVNFVYGLLESAVSIAAEVDGEVVAGVVKHLWSGVEYAAARGLGSDRDGVPLRVRPAVPLGQRLVLTGFSYRPEARAGQAEQIARLLPRVRDIRRMGSSALDICHVAEGAADGYVEEGSMPWDWSAASLVATEAGARFGVLPGPLFTELLGATGPTVVVTSPADGWEDFVTLLTECGFVAPEGE